MIALEKWICTVRPGHCLGLTAFYFVFLWYNKKTKYKVNILAF